MLPFAARAPPRFGETSPITKNILAFKALRRHDMKLLLLRGNRAPDVGQVVTDLFFPNSQGHRKLPSAIFLFGKEDYHLLPGSLFGRTSLFRHAVARFQTLGLPWLNPNEGPASTRPRQCSLYSAEGYSLLWHSHLKRPGPLQDAEATHLSIGEAPGRSIVLRRTHSNMHFYRASPSLSVRIYLEQPRMYHSIVVFSTGEDPRRQCC